MNATQSAIRRALELCRVLDVEHNAASVSFNFRAVRHELKTLEALHFPQAPAQPAELRSAHTGRATTPGSQRHKALAALAVTPQADFQLANALRIDVGLIRRRRHELLAAGWVAPAPSVTGQAHAKTRQERTGRDCTVYQLTTAGFAALARLRAGQAVQAVLFTDAELDNDSDSKADTSRGSDVVRTYKPGAEYL